MKILINAISIKEGGSKVVLNQLLKRFVSLFPEHEWYVATNSVLQPSIPDRPAIKPLLFDYPNRSPLHLRWWYEFTLPKLVNELHIDVLFSQTNYLPSRRLACPRFLLVQHAGHFSRIFSELIESQSTSPIDKWLWRAKSRWVRNSVKRADVVTVQTDALAAEIVAQTGVAANKLEVIPHGPGLLTEGRARPYPDTTVWSIGCISKIGIQKNFSTVFNAIRLIRDTLPVRFILSLDESTEEYASVHAMIAEAGIADVVVNYGEVGETDIQKIFDELDIFIFPSLCESFGFPLVEAMARGLPVVAADIPSTAEIGGNAILKFEVCDAGSLAHHLRTLIAEKSTYEWYSQQSMLQARKFSWDNAAVRTMDLITKLAEASPLQAKTGRHYDSHPFEFLTDMDEGRIEELQPVPFQQFVERYLEQGDAVGEIGCGPGRGTMYLALKNIGVTALDLSLKSLVLARKRAPAAKFAQGTNLSLPFPDECFQAVVSDGVIHHTPNPLRSFRENARVLKSGGVMYLGVYNRHGYYYYVYTYAGVPVRWLEKFRWGKFLVNSTLLPAYYLVHLIKTRGKRSWKGAKSFFYDYIITPQASFHSKAEIESWGKSENLELVDYHAEFGNVHVFIFKKN